MNFKSVVSSLFAAAFMALAVVGCIDNEDPTLKRCVDGTCAVEGRLFYMYSSSSRGGLLDQMMELRSKTTNEVIARTPTDANGFFRFTTLDEDIIFEGGGTGDEPPGIIVCASGGSPCFDFQELPGGCDTLPPMDLPEDPPLGGGFCGALVFSPNGGADVTQATAATAFSTDGAVALNYEHAVAAVAEGALKGDFEKRPEFTAGGPLEFVNIELVYAWNHSRVAASTQVIKGSSGTGGTDCNDNRYCFNFSAVKPGKYVVRININGRKAKITEAATNIRLASPVVAGKSITLEMPQDVSTGDRFAVEVIGIK